LSDLREGIILFAHGSRDPQWAAPFQAIAESLARKLPDAVVGLAYLEQMAPSLNEALAALIANDIRKIRVVPLFFGQGGHIKEDLPKLVSSARKAHPDVLIELETPIGERPEVVEAIAEAIVKISAAKQAGRSSP
jgi:sirohydrochlorin cobaltochelatase